MRPPSIVKFDWLYLALLILSCFVFALTYDTTLAPLKADPAAVELGLAGAGFILSLFGFGMVILLLLWFFVSRRASNAARWNLTVIAAFSLVSLPFSVGDMPTLTILVELALLALQIASVWFLFRPDAAAWFKHGPRGMDADVFE